MEAHRVRCMLITEYGLKAGTLKARSSSQEKEKVVGKLVRVGVLDATCSPMMVHKKAVLPHATNNFGFCAFIGGSRVHERQAHWSDKEIAGSAS